MVTVWNYDRLGRNIFLGEVLIPMESVVDSQIELENATPVWYTLQEKVWNLDTKIYQLPLFKLPLF